VADHRRLHKLSCALRSIPSKRDCVMCLRMFSLPSDQPAIPVESNSRVEYERCGRPRQ
jgi:hypothetical protein